MKTFIKTKWGRGAARSAPREFRARFSNESILRLWNETVEILEERGWEYGDNGFERKGLVLLSPKGEAADPFSCAVCRAFQLADALSTPLAFAGMAESENLRLAFEAGSTWAEARGFFEMIRARPGRRENPERAMAIEAHFRAGVALWKKKGGKGMPQLGDVIGHQELRWAGPGREPSVKTFQNYWTRYRGFFSR